MISAGVPARGRGGSLPLCVLLFVLTLGVSAPGARAGEPLYVIEQLVVSVSSTPDGTGDPVATLKSGERVELLERQDDEAQVQLANGTSGWVKASYLSSELPLQRRLQDRTAEVEKLKQEVSRLQSQLAARPLPTAATAAPPPPPATPARPVDVPTQAAAPAPSGTAATAPENAQTAVRDPSSFMGSPDQSGQPPWVWILSCSAGALALGFVAGWRVLDRRIRRKYGGLKIY
jgi:hypothetical protein